MALGHSGRTGSAEERSQKMVWAVLSDIIHRRKLEAKRYGSGFVNSVVYSNFTDTPVKMALVEPQIYRRSEPQSGRNGAIFQVSKCHNDHSTKR